MLCTYNCVHLISRECSSEEFGKQIFVGSNARYKIFSNVLHTFFVSTIFAGPCVDIDLFVQGLKDVRKGNEREDTLEFKFSIFLTVVVDKKGILFNDNNLCPLSCPVLASLENWPFPFFGNLDNLS